MMGSVFWLLVISPLLVLAYAVFCSRLLHATQSLRLELARRGEALLLDQRLPEHRRKLVHLMLDNPFNGFVAPTLAALLPFWALWEIPRIALFKVRRLRLDGGIDRGIVDEETRSDFRRVAELFATSVMAVSPLAAVIVATECAILFVLSASLPGVVGALSEVVLQTVGDPAGMLHRRDAGTVRHA
jgi:hypothetical protein